MVSEFVRRCKQAKFNKQASPHPINKEGEIFWQIWTIHEGYSSMLPNSMRHGIRRSFRASLSEVAKYNTDIPDYPKLPEKTEYMNTMCGF